jgi:Subtilase family
MTTSQFSAGTVDSGARDIPLYAAGKKSGHGAIAWLPAPDYEMPAAEPWPPGPGRHPVIALLDSWVDQEHFWLPPPRPDTPFVTDAACKGWPGPDLDDDDPPPVDGSQGYGSHQIHGTFIAGLIRRIAPDAQVLSMKVMNSQGKVDQSDVVTALNWLAGHAHDVPVDIVLMAFGRQADPDDPDLHDLRKAISQLSQVSQAGQQTKVQIVASAGNHGSADPVYPAAFAAEPGHPVVSVGAHISPTERAAYSNYGPWVREWRNGTNILSISPLTTIPLDDGGVPVTAQTRSGSSYTVAAEGNGYAWWSGTSFAAAVHAAKLARQMSDAWSLPQHAAGS